MKRFLSLSAFIIGMVIALVFSSCTSPTRQQIEAKRTASMPVAQHLVLKQDIQAITYLDGGITIMTINYQGEAVTLSLKDEQVISAFSPIPATDELGNKHDEEIGVYVPQSIINSRK